MAQILVELIKLANMIVTLTKTAACADRVCAVMNAKSSMPVNVLSDEADKKLKKAEVLDFDKEAPKGSSVELITRERAIMRLKRLILSQIRVRQSV